MKDLHKNVEILKQIPALEYVTNIRSRDYRHILADGVPIYNVTNRAEFYSTLGCTLENSGGNPDEYIWNRYSGNDSPISKQCLQIQIFIFLCIASGSFQRKYSNLKKKLLGSCLSQTMDNHDDHCLNCPLHPRDAY